MVVFVHICDGRAADAAAAYGMFASTELSVVGGTWSSGKVFACILCPEVLFIQNFRVHGTCYIVSSVTAVVYCHETLHLNGVLNHVHWPVFMWRRNNFNSLTNSIIGHYCIAWDPCGGWVDRTAGSNSMYCRRIVARGIMIIEACCISPLSCDHEMAAGQWFSTYWTVRQRTGRSSNLAGRNIQGAAAVQLKVQQYPF
jgi:hypothetical protein